MAWIALSDAKLLTRISGKELERLRAAALAAGQTDPVAEVFDTITRKVRSRVAANGSNRLGPAGTIPDELLDDALALCVVEVMTRPGGTMIDPESARAKAADTAERNLRDAANGLIAIEQPSSEQQSAEVIGAPMPSIRPKTRRFTQVDENGA